MRLFEIKVLEEEERDGMEDYALDATFDHPRRYRFINCWLQYENDSTQGFRPVGGEGTFNFTNGYCPKFSRYSEAWVVGEIDESRLMEADRFSKAESPQTHSLHSLPNEL